MCYHPLTRRVIIAKDIDFDGNRFYYQTNIEPKGEQESIKREALTPLPFLNRRDKQEIQPPQEIQENTMKIDSQPATVGDNQPSTYPKYYVRRNKQPTTHTQDGKEGIIGRVAPEEDTSTEKSGEKELPIALRKPTRACVKPIPHSISNYLNCGRVSVNFRAFLPTLNQVIVPTTVGEALQHPQWRKVMDEKMQALIKNLTWEVVNMRRGIKPIGCRWVFNIKNNLDGEIERYNPRLVAKGYTQTYGLDYEKTFTRVAKMNTIRILLSLAILLDWKLRQYVIKNVFLLI